MTVWAAWFVLAFAAVAPAADLPGGGQQQEYFVRQNADEALLVRIDGREAQFEAIVASVEGEILVASGVPGSRVAPLFLYVSAPSRERQLDIRVTAPFDTNRTRFDMGLSRITVRDSRSGQLARAYQLLSFGLELPPADTAANWSIKVNAMNEAARLFEAFGMEEYQTWARYFAARLTYSGLGDNAAALRLADELLASAGARRRPPIFMAGLQLRGEVLSALRGAGELPPSDSGSDPVQEAALATADFAASLGLLFERADALFLAGQGLADLGGNEAALALLEESLEIADSIEANDLSTAVRERLVEIHGQQGDMAATSEVLQAIESQLTEDGANDELAQNLLAQGRILNQTYRYNEARDVLRQALEFEHNSATRSQVRLALAEAHWAIGEIDEAWAQARAAVINPSSGGYRRPTAVLDTQFGVGILAGVARARGDRGPMAQLREAQRTLLETSRERVLWNWERAIDELQGGRRSSAAVPFLRQVRDGSRSAGLEPYADLARLWLCLLDTDCPEGAVTRSRAALRDAGQPRHHVAGEWLTARIANRAGRRTESANILSAAVRDMIFLRNSVPGVLGAFSWQRVDAIGEELLSVRRSTGNDEALMLDLARLRWLRASGPGTRVPFDRDTAGLDTDAFRALLARRERPEAGDDPSRLATEIRAQLDRGRQVFDAQTPFLEDRAIASWLSSLEDGAAVLDFDVSGDRALALVGTRAGVRRYDLGPASALADWPGALESFSDLSPSAFESVLDRGGRQWLGPIVAALPGRVYLATSDALAYLPFEAFRVAGGERFGVSRSVVRLASFPSNPGPAAQLAGFSPQRVFVAGAPSDFQAGFLSRLETDAELRTVMDRFVGPGLQVVQGSALLPDEFSTDAFQSAQLVHLAMPASIDTVQPEKSRLELSEPRGGAGRTSVPVGGFSAWRTEARLLVFSQAELELPVSANGGRPPLVSGALGAGAGAVLSTAWRGDDSASAGLFAAFYDELGAGAAIDEALRNARRNGAVPLQESARFQLWLD